MCGTASTTHRSSGGTSTTCCASRTWRSGSATCCDPSGSAKLAGTPTLIIWGHENPFGDVPEAHAMHDDIPGSRLELYAECGHWPQYEHPELYNAMSIAFLQEHPC